MRKLWIIPLVLVASPTLAAMWTVDAATSKLTFEGEQSGEKFKGGFSKFTPTIDFDPAHPEKGKIDVVIDMASVTVEGKDRQDALPTSDWFDVKQFGTAEFHSTKIACCAERTKSIGKAYIVDGDLTLRSVKKPVHFEFEFAPKPDGTALAIGGLTLNRNDYGIGQGEWKSDAYIKYPVTVSFEIHARQKQ